MRVPGDKEQNPEAERNKALWEKFMEYFKAAHALTWQGRNQRPEWEAFKAGAALRNDL